MAMSPCGARSLRDVLIASIQAWLWSTLSLPRLETDQEPLQQEPANIFSQSTPRPLLSAHGTPIPPEVEKEIVSRLAIDFQGKESRTTKAGECNSMEDLLQRLGNLFPENQDNNNSTNNKKDCCCLCKSEAIFYPYKLADCDHIACGRCIYTTGVEHCGQAMQGSCQLCGQAIRNEPKRLDNYQLYHAQSKWTMANKDYNCFLKQNEERVHKGNAGVFGREEEVPDTMHEPFDGVGYVGSFDRLPVLDITTTQTLPETRSQALRLTYCPAHHNYSGFPIASFRHLETPSKLMPLFQALRHLYKEDIYMLEDDDHRQLNESPDRFNVRLTGWEQFAKRKRVKIEQEMKWQRVASASPRC